MDNQLSITLTAVPENAGASRWYIRNFIDGLSLEEEAIADILTCTGEAVANVIEHAYTDSDFPGPFHIMGVIVGDVINFLISDEGNWKEPVVSEERGRGLPLMKALSESCLINPVPETKGTVIMLSFPLIKKAQNALRKVG
jgi:anti-sigma regulatory factor (Ser/Thr protein kinase)